MINSYLEGSYVTQSSGTQAFILCKIERELRVHYNICSCRWKVKLSSAILVMQLLQMASDLYRWGVEHSTILCYATCENGGVEHSTVFIIGYATCADEVELVQRCGVDAVQYFVMQLVQMRGVTQYNLCRWGWFMEWNSGCNDKIPWQPSFVGQWKNEWSWYSPR